MMARIESTYILQCRERLLSVRDGSLELEQKAFTNCKREIFIIGKKNDSKKKEYLPTAMQREVFIS
jgi:hypothetical protein